MDVNSVSTDWNVVFVRSVGEFRGERHADKFAVEMYD